MLIGLCGYPGSGKSEVRDILVKEHGFYLLDTKIIIRQMASALTGLPSSEFVTQEQKAALYNGITRRKIMGELGNAVEGLYGDSFLVNAAIKRFREKAPDRPIVVDALRKDQPKDFPGLVAQVISSRAQEPKDDFDRFYQGRTNCIIVNDGTHQELSETVKRVLGL
jgi:dephospho-CoA kinase